MWRGNYGENGGRGGIGRGRGTSDNSTENYGSTWHTKLATTDEEWPDNTVGNGNIDCTTNRETIQVTQLVHMESQPAAPSLLP